MSWFHKALHNRKTGTKVIHCTHCHVWWSCMLAPSRKSKISSPASVENKGTLAEHLLKFFCLKNQQRKAVEICFNNTLCAWWHLLLRWLFWVIAVFSNSIKRKKRKNTKTNEQEAKLTKIPFAIKIRGKRGSCLTQEAKFDENSFYYQNKRYAWFGAWVMLHPTVFGSSTKCFTKLQSCLDLFSFAGILKQRLPSYFIVS